MEVEETPEESHANMDSEQGEASATDEWADRHYGRVDPANNDNVEAHSNANRMMKLINARSTLRDRYSQAALQVNWEEAAAISRAIAER